MINLPFRPQQEVDAEENTGEIGIDALHERVLTKSSSECEGEFHIVFYNGLVIITDMAFLSCVTSIYLSCSH